MHRGKFIAIVMIVAAFLLAIVPVSKMVLAFPGGISGYSGNPATSGGAICTVCHSGGTAPTVTLTGPASVAPGSTNTYTLTIGGGQRVSGALDVSATAGTLASISGQGTQLMSGEITHTSPKAVDGSGNVSFSFSWTAPASGSATLYGSGLSANGDGGTSGDNAAKTSLAVSVVVPPATYTITASAGVNGSITPSGAVTVNSGASQSFTIAANSGYHVASVLVDGASVGAVTSYTFNSVTTNHTISASFAINTYTITASAGANGSIAPSGAVTVNSGASQNFTIAANSGYHVASVLVDGASVGAVTSYTFTGVTANHTISASFAADAVTTYTITASAGANGSITPSGAVTVNLGASQSFTIAASAGYHVASVLVDSASVGAVTSYIFNSVTTNHTISASFAADAVTTYTITASAGANGSITPSGAVTVNSGGSRTFTITANSGYHVADVLVDGASMGAVMSYTFNSVTTNHTISASFAANTSNSTYTIYALAGPHGSITPSGKVKVMAGASQTFTITAAAGYHVAMLIVDGKHLSPVTSYTFTNITANHFIVVGFRENDDTGSHSINTHDD